MHVRAILSAPAFAEADGRSGAEREAEPRDPRSLPLVGARRRGIERNPMGDR